ncbi:hypothetical protein KFL_000240340 [Klebsormidium nitens]|uniref:Uncharacterized protein n=1 Tax=Klebsormidium nitens TaxID=105231 RepID=A0A1Y1HM78_KLENI|nr:hypothetical protein KFL_000240340 [Klebsormidium nitens]|eukprot:GAQ79103.1 hypothetical protein KFL_000240340 [Klebsormidium nitens]
MNRSTMPVSKFRPDAVCGPCFTALTSTIAGLLTPAPGAAPPAIAAAATARDCATVALARLLAQNPGFYRVGALLNQAFNGTGCPAASVSGSMANPIPGP